MSTRKEYVVTLNPSRDPNDKPYGRSVVHTPYSGMVKTTSNVSTKAAPSGVRVNPDTGLPFIGN